MLDPRGDVMAFAGLPSPLRVAVLCPDHRVYNSMRISSVASNRQRTDGAWRPAAGHSCQRPAAAISSQQHEPHQQQHIAASAALPVQVYWTVLLASHSRGGRDHSLAVVEVQRPFAPSIRRKHQVNPLYFLLYLTLPRTLHHSIPHWCSDCTLCARLPKFNPYTVSSH